MIHKHFSQDPPTSSIKINYGTIFCIYNITRVHWWFVCSYRATSSSTWRRLRSSQKARSFIGYLWPSVGVLWQRLVWHQFRDWNFTCCENSAIMLLRNFESLPYVCVDLVWPIVLLSDVVAIIANLWLCKIMSIGVLNEWVIRFIILQGDVGVHSSLAFPSWWKLAGEMKFLKKGGKIWQKPKKESGKDILFYFIQFKCHASQASMICLKCHTCLVSHNPCTKVLVGAYAK